MQMPLNGARLAVLLGVVVVAGVSAPDAALARRPSKAAAKLGKLAKKLLRKKNFDGSIEMFRNAYAEDPHPGFLLGMATAHQKKGEHSRAMEILANVAKSDDRKSAKKAARRLKKLKKNLAETQPRGSAPSAPSKVRVGVMSLREGKAGTVSRTTIDMVSSLLWDAAMSTRGILPLAEPHLAAAMGTDGVIARCKEDACMSSFGSAAGLDRVVYAVADQGRADAWAVYIRALSMTPPALLAQVTLSCQGCNEGTALQIISEMDLRSVFAAGGAASNGPESAKGVRLSLSSTPSGARVSLGDRPLGTTPLDGVDLPVGQHLLTLECPSPAAPTPPSSTARNPADGAPR